MKTDYPELRLPTAAEKKLLKGVLFSNAQIKQRAQEIAQDILKQTPKVDVLICNLNGGHYWGNELEKHLKPHKRIDIYISVHDSFPDKNQQKAQMKLKDISESAVVVVAEDIIATGRTLEKILKIIPPCDLFITTMINNYQLRFKEFNYLDSKINYEGFRINKEQFIVGFGIKGIKPLTDDMKQLKHIYESRKLPLRYSSRYLNNHE